MWSALYKDKAPWLDSNIQSAGIAAAVAGEIARLTVLEVKVKYPEAPRLHALMKSTRK
ncbi:MAG: hypothetical protein ACLUTU_00645 [Blautia faecis]